MMSDLHTLPVNMFKEENFSTFSKTDTSLQKTKQLTILPK